MTTTPKKTTMEIRLGDANIDDAVEEITGFTYVDSYYDTHHSEVRLYELKGTTSPEQIAEFKHKCRDFLDRCYDHFEMGFEEEADFEADYDEDETEDAEEIA
jgi:hypothetical protein